MISTVIWISSTEAHIFRLSPTKVEEQRFRTHESLKERRQNEPHASEVLFRDVVQAMAPHQDRYLILGSGPAKLHFAAYLKDHAPAASKRVVGVEGIDKMTDGEMMDFAHRYFKKADTYEAIG